MQDYDELPQFDPSVLRRVPEEVYAQSVQSVVRKLGVTEEEAERVVDAVLGPLWLVSPMPRFSNGRLCNHSYFSEEGEWHFCTEDHEVPDDDPTEFHSSDKEEWGGNRGFNRWFRPRRF